MERSFSLKVLFVGIAFLALLCGWVADHRQLRNDLDREKAAVLSLKKTQNDAFAVVEYWLGQHFDSIGEENGDHLFASGGELNETLAFGLVASCIPNITLDKVTFTTTGEGLMGLRYDHRREGDKHTYRLRQQ